MPHTHGFDMIPPLTPTRTNRILYQTFINILIARYSSPSAKVLPAFPSTPAHSRSSSRSGKQLQGVAQLVPAPHGAYLLFLTSALPVIPCNAALCHYFVQFSCDISLDGHAPSPSLASEVYELALGIFGKRVCWWSTAEGIRSTGFWDQWYLDDMHRCMMQALESGWVEVDGERRTLLEIERGEEDDRPPPVPPKEDGNGKVFVKTHRKQDSGISVTSPISLRPAQRFLPSRLPPGPPPTQLPPGPPAQLSSRSPTQLLPITLTQLPPGPPSRIPPGPPPTQLPPGPPVQVQPGPPPRTPSVPPIRMPLEPPARSPGLPARITTEAPTRTPPEPPTRMPPGPPTRMPPGPPLVVPAPPVPPKVEGDGRGYVKTHRRQDSGISVTSPISNRAPTPEFPEKIPETAVLGGEPSLDEIVEGSVDDKTHDTHHHNKLGEWMFTLRPRRDKGREDKEDYIMIWHND